MHILCWLGYIFFGFILFLLTNYGENKKGISSSQRLVFTIIYLLIIAGIVSSLGFTNFNTNIFVVTVFELFIRIIYYSYILEKDFFDRGSDRFKLSLAITAFSFVVNQFFINKVSNVFLSYDDLRIVVWLVVIYYIYMYISTYEKKHLIEASSDKNIGKELIVVSYAKLKLKYDEDIKIDNNNLRLVLYSIMIFSNYNRPKFFRKMDNVIFRINSNKRKLGIMQVDSKKFITDSESIEIVCKKIEKLVGKNKLGKGYNYLKLFESYDKNNSEQLYSIFEEIRKFNNL